MHRRLAVLFLLTVVTATALAQTPPSQAPVDLDRIGPAVGAIAPDFSLPDARGVTHALSSLLGPKGALVVFSRSADWWPYCRTQLVELQRQAASLAAEGRGLAVITYDSPEVLARFAEQYGITYPLLSDRGSAVIRRYGLLNPSYAPDSRAHGVPYPGTFVLDRSGRVVSRHFETAYQERSTVASILARAGRPGQGPLIAAQSAHLSVQAMASDGVVAPGNRLTLTFEVTPARGMHVYAPGKHTYQVIRFQLTPESWLTAHPMQYATPEIYHFVPLDERVETYQRPFTLRQDVTIAATPEAQKLLAGRTSITIGGRLDYQACDDRVCYAPASLPLAFSLDLTRLVAPK